MNSCDGMTRSDVTCLWNSPGPSAWNTRVYFSRSVSTEQSGAKPGSLPHLWWELMQKRVQDNCPQHQRLEARYVNNKAVG